MQNIIQSLEADNSRLAKEAILEAEAKKNNTELFDGLRLAQDPLVTFGVKQVPKHGGPDGQGLPWAAFLELAELLKDRKLTGHAARDAIELALSASTQAQWNDWYRRILTKKLDCGVSEKTINKVLKGYPAIPPVPLFECMLAHDGAKHENKIKGKKLLEPKLDGIRVLTVINATSRTVVQYSRNGNVLENFTKIVQGFEDNIDDFDRSWVIDGEMISTSFQALMKQVQRKSDVQTDDAVYAVFDIIPLSEFINGKSVLGQRRRSALLKTFKPTLDKVGNIIIVPQVEVDLDTYVGELQYKEFNKKALEDKYEGIMLKDPDAPYECKRSTSWLKEKPFIEVSLTATKVVEGTGRNEGRMGAVEFSGEDDGKYVEVSVGGGWSDQDRDEIWRLRDTIPGQVGEIRGDALTLNQDSDNVWSIRFPRFRTWRGFKAGEKI